MHSVLSTQRIRVQKISRWAIAPVVDARTVAIAIRLILKLDLDEALSSFQKRKQITEPEAYKPGSTPHPQPLSPKRGEGSKTVIMDYLPSPRSGARGAKQ